MGLSHPEKTCFFLSRYVFLDKLPLKPFKKLALPVLLSSAAIHGTEVCRHRVKCSIILICALLKFWLGILLIVLFAVLLLMKQSETLSSKLKKKDEAIALEMPRFVRTICRNLRSNRDIYAALQSYRKVAGPVLGAELDILLAHMRAGGVSLLCSNSKVVWNGRGISLCSILMEIDSGIDQTALSTIWLTTWRGRPSLKFKKHFHPDLRK
jgi:hypothetical protein